MSILQQTDASDSNTDDSMIGSSDATGNEPTVLEEVIDKATAKSELEQEINALSAGVNADAFGTVKALRKLRHERLQKRLFVLDKDARLRSGMRGLQARKALVQFEKEVAESAALLVPLNRPPDNDPNSHQHRTKGGRHRSRDPPV